MSRSFTAAVHDLVRTGVLDLDDRLGDIVPRYGIPDERADSITVDELLTHASGLTRSDGLAHADLFDTEPGAVTRAAQGLDDVTLARAPGAGYEYSDLNYLLLGAIIVEAGGRPFAETVTRVAGDAGVDLVATPTAAGTLPPGHRQLLGQPVGFDSDYDASGTPYGYLGTDVDGLGAWARAQLGGGGLRADALESMHTGHVETGSGDRYGHGWRIGEVDGEPTVQHTGATPGYFSHVLLLPDSDTAVVVLANAYSEARAPSLAAVAGDVARIDAGEEPTGATDDTLLTVAPFVVVGLALLGLVVAVVAARGRRRRRVIALVVGVPVVALVLLAPGLLGYTSEQLRLWAPDIGWGLWAVAATWALVVIGAAAGLVPRSTPRSAADLEARHT